MQTLDAGVPSTGRGTSIYWMRVQSYLPGATYQLDGERPKVINGSEHRVARRDAPWQELATTGTVVIEYSTDPNEPAPPTGNSLPAMQFDAAGNLKTTAADSGYSITGTLVNSGDTLTLAMTGVEWASAAFTVLTAAGVTTNIAAEYTLDGVNWYGAGDVGTTARFFAPYIRRTDAVAQYPTTIQANATTPLNVNSWAASTAWDFPLSGAVVAARLRVTTGGGGSALCTLSTGKAMAVGTPVVATYEINAGGVNSAVDSGAIDFQGWTLAAIYLEQIAGTITTSFIETYMIDDSGNFNCIQKTAITAAGAGFTGNPTSAYYWGTPGSAPSANCLGPRLPRRARILLDAASSLQITMRIEVSRNVC